MKISRSIFFALACTGVFWAGWFYSKLNKQDFYHLYFQVIAEIDARNSQPFQLATFCATPRTWISLSQNPSLFQLENLLVASSDEEGTAYNYNVHPLVHAQLSAQLAAQLPFGLAPPSVI